MEYFTVIPEGQAIMVSRGVYRQVPIYVRGGKVYARHGGGYVRLIQGGRDVCAEYPLGRDRHPERHA